jgi:hypothetical protein
MIIAHRDLFNRWLTVLWAVIALASQKLIDCRVDIESGPLKLSYYHVYDVLYLTDNRSARFRR